MGTVCRIMRDIGIGRTGIIRAGPSRGRSPSPGVSIGRIVKEGPGSRAADRTGVSRRDTQRRQSYAEKTRDEENVSRRDTRLRSYAETTGPDRSLPSSAGRGEAQGPEGLNPL